MLKHRLEDLLVGGLAEGLFTAGAVAAWTPFEEVGQILVGETAATSKVPVDGDTLFDLASVSKTFVAAAILTLVEEGKLSLDDTVFGRVPVGGGEGSSQITLRHLLTHTSGLPSDSFAWKSASLTPDEKLAAALSMPLQTQPGAEFRYSCTNYIAAGLLAETVTDQSLNRIVAERIFEPIGARHLTFTPASTARCVATEVQDYLGRGLVCGEVHDELAWSLQRTTGNAGVFGTADDVLLFARTILDEGIVGHREVLGPQAARHLTKQIIEPGRGASFGHSLGLRVADAGFMGAVKGIGHTGFTGTMFVVDPVRRTAVVLLTNSVHPVRGVVDLGPFRCRVTELVATATDAAANLS
jgi:CubicO group peptidase (beta-lactamase class C family)